MRFEIYELSNSKKYLFIVGTRAKPDTLLKERIRSQFEEAMSSLKVPGADYSLSIVQSETAEESPAGTPKIGRAGKYLIVALLESEGNQRPLDSDLEEEKEEISRGLTTILPDNSRGALIVLYDCNIKCIEADRYYPPAPLVGSPKKGSRGTLPKIGGGKDPFGNR